MGVEVGVVQAQVARALPWASLQPPPPHTRVHGRTHRCGRGPGWRVVVWGALGLPNPLPFLGPQQVGGGLPPWGRPPGPPALLPPEGPCWTCWALLGVLLLAP